MLAVVLTVGIFFGHLWSNYKTAKLEHDVESAKTATADLQRSAVQKEKEAQGYRAKIEYLEQKLNEIQNLATKQDEELEKLTTHTGDARSDIERARRIRAIATTTEELCRKLAEVGHPCD